MSLIADLKVESLTAIVATEDEIIIKAWTCTIGKGGSIILLMDLIGWNSGTHQERNSNLNWRFHSVARVNNKTSAVHSL